MVRGVEESSAFQWCHQRWVGGVAWEDTDAYDLLLKRINRSGVAEGCRSYEDIVDRYRRLDEIFAQVQAEGRLRATWEVRDSAFRESDGILVHLGPDLEPILGRNGLHRFAMARVLQLRRIPACLGLIHADAVHKWPACYTVPMHR